MKNLKAKLRKDGGFTLIEMLIVVAIIAILVAVSIPMVANSLDKTRHATDAANERAAKAEMVLQYLADNDATIYGTGAANATVTVTKVVADTVYYYDAVNGRLAAANTDINPYGQCTKGTTNVGKVIAVKVDAKGQVTLGWGAADGADLCSAAKNSDHTTT